MTEVNIKDLSRPKLLDEIAEYLFGIDNILERMILQFIYKNQNYTASYFELEREFVFVRETCSSRRLSARLSSLVKFGFINVAEINNHTFYSINNEWLLELRKKNLESC